MDITLSRIAILARFVFLPLVLACDFAIGWLPINKSLLMPAHFVLGYATAVVLLMAFGRRSPFGLAVVAWIILALAWAVGLSGNESLTNDEALHGLIPALVGVLCAIVPASMREWQKLGPYMSFREFRLLSRRRRGGEGARKPEKIYLLAAPYHHKADVDVLDLDVLASDVVDGEDIPPAKQPPARPLQSYQEILQNMKMN